MKYKKIEIQNLTDFEKKRKGIYIDMTNEKIKINQIAIEHEVSRFTVSKKLKIYKFLTGHLMSQTKIKEIKIDKSLVMIFVDSKIEKIRDFSSFVFDQPTDRTRNVTMAVYYRTKGSIMSFKTLTDPLLKRGMQQSTYTKQLEKKLKETQKIF
ncbi:hypothetical protein [Mycoplasma sp. 125]|uniref:hypothetical protein n=1 Tax=Mycoplasma sp. 125 TaxID=3447505 RepID=UPI003F65F24F